jgi:hypothetical protein
MSGHLFNLRRQEIEDIIRGIQSMRLVGADFGSTCVFEPILDHHTVIDIEGGPNVASAVSNPVAPELSLLQKFRMMLRNF